MALIDEVRLAVRTSSKATDAEIQMWVDAALADMLRVGVASDLLEQESLAALPKAAVVCYVKAHYGYDIEERAQFDQSYRDIVVNLMHSKANVSAWGSNG